MKESRINAVLPSQSSLAGEGLVLEGVRHRYGGRQVVRGVDLTVRPGELVCLLGPSGCGKTTTLRIAAGLEHPQEGRVTLGGVVVADGGLAVPPEQRQVGFLFQDFALFPHLTVIANVEFGLRGLGASERRARAEACLAQVGMLDYAMAFPHMLSGGQQQRVALARALAPKPRLMLLDEPFSGLDSRLRESVRDETLHVLKQSGVCTLMVTHDPEEAMFMADRIALMKDGEIVQQGAPVELYFHPKEAFVASFFGEVNRIEGEVRQGRVATLFGPIDAPGLAEGAPVEVLVRPEALQLKVLAGNQPGLCPAQVMASRMLGRSSLIHFCAGDVCGVREHLHSRMPGRFLPREGEILDVALDHAQAFVFPRNETKS